MNEEYSWGKAKQNRTRVIADYCGWSNPRVELRLTCSGNRKNFLVVKPPRRWVVIIGAQSSKVDPKWHILELCPKNVGRNLEKILDCRKSRKHLYWKSVRMWCLWSIFGSQNPFYSPFCWKMVKVKAHFLDSLSATLTSTCSHVRCGR